MRYSTVLATAAAMFIAGTLPAQIILYDSFSYPNGALVGNGGWTNHSGTPGDLLVSSNEVVVQHGVPSEDAHLPFTPVGGNIYYGVDFRVAAPGGAAIPGTDNEYFIHFRTGFDFSARLDVVPATGGGDYSVGIASDESTADAVWPSDLVYGNTYRAVVRYDQNMNQAELWIDASLATDPSILGEDRPDPGDSVDSIALRQSDSDLNETVYVDNLAVGQSFADVACRSAAVVNAIGISTGLTGAFGPATLASAAPIIGTTPILNLTYANAAPEPAALLISLGSPPPAGTPFDGIILYVDLGPTLGAVGFTSNGGANIPIAIPPDPAFCTNVSVYFQMIVQDSGCDGEGDSVMGTLPLIATNGLEWIIGQ